MLNLEENIFQTNEGCEPVAGCGRDNVAGREHVSKPPDYAKCGRILFCFPGENRSTLGAGGISQLNHAGHLCSVLCLSTLFPQSKMVLKQLFASS